MKIWCDVCSSKEASVFCSADEASLCLDCDPKVHHANKLASKHQRFSLLKPTSSDYPVCDICQEKKALLFCQQDRAILCRDCDFSIHAANEHTQKHNRYLLTGIKLSPSTTNPPPTPTATATATISSTTTDKRISKGGDSSASFDQVPDFKSQNSTTKKTAPSSANYSPEIKSTLTNINNNNNSRHPAAPNNSSMLTTASKDESIQLISSGGGGGGRNNSDGSTTSSISEYLIEMLPGWQVEDLLQDSSALPFVYSKMQDNNNFLGTDLLSNRDDGNNFENMGLWVPQAPPPPLIPHPQPSPFSTNIAFGMNHHVLQNHQGRAETTMHKKSSSRKKMMMMMNNNNNNPNDGFMVPQISPQFLNGGCNKRSRPFC